MGYLIEFKIFYYVALLILLLILIKILNVSFKIVKERKILKELSKSGIKSIDLMDGFQFEIFLKSLFKQLGYKTEVTKGSHDYGADLIIKKNGEKIVIQAKRYGFKNKVGIDAIQQVYSATPYYKASGSWVITNSMFTKNASVLAKACNVNLIDRHELINFINKANPNKTAKQVTENVLPKERTCPECKGTLLQRTSKANNRFMGCENFPRCKHTQPIAIN